MICLGKAYHLILVLKLLGQEGSLLAVRNPDLGVHNLRVKEARKRCQRAEAGTDQS